MTGAFSYLTSLVDFGNGITLTDSGAFVVKYDPEGKPQWARTLHSAGTAWAVAVDAHGNSFVAGASPEPITFNPNVTIWKVAADGDLSWTRAAVGAYAENGIGISTDGAGNVSVTGDVGGGSATFGAGEPNETILTSLSAGSVLFIAKYNTSGTLLWARQSIDEAGRTTRGEKITGDSAGNSYLVGNGFPILGPGEPDETEVERAFVLKYDASGGLVWAKTLKPGLVTSFATAVAHSSAGQNTATITITVTPVNDAPIAHDQVLAIVTGPTHGTLTGLGPGRIYTPNPGYTGPDGFTSTASDGLAVSAPATVAITVASSHLGCGSLISGSITLAGEVDEHVFAGSAGQLISLALASTGGFATNRGSGSVQLTLLAPSGAAVGTLRSNSQANFVLLEAGTYVVRVNATNLGNAGSYNVNLECLFPTQSPDTVVMTCGTPTSGSISAPGEVNLYSFLASPSQISLTLVSTGGFASNRGSNSVALALFTPSGVSLGTLRSDGQADFVLPEQGTYVVAASAANLARTGSFNATLVCPAD